MKVTLLAIGGPRHGEQLPVQDGVTYHRVLVPPDLSVATVLDRPPVRWCVHGGRVTSAFDGQKHHVSAPEVAMLYGVELGTWKFARVTYASELYREHRKETCLHPDPTGAYKLPWVQGEYTVTDIAFTMATYEKRVIADRAVYVYVGDR